MLDLVTAGEAFDDFVFHGLAQLPRQGEEIKTDRLLRSPGGGAVITAVAASRLGLHCAMLGGLSRDAVQVLHAERVRVRNVRRAGEPAPMTVAISTVRDRAFVTFNGMNGRLPGRLRRALSRVRARHVHLAFCPGACRPWQALIRSLGRKGIGTSWDFGWNPTLRDDPHFWPLAMSVDYLFINREEAIVYAGARSLSHALDRWRGSASLVVVKLGAAGARIVGSGNDLREKAVSVRVVDTTGAGDAFNAGFLAGRLRGLDLREALKLANRVGALSTRRPGGLAGLPRIRSKRPLRRRGQTPFARS